MERTSELSRILGQELKWNKARLSCFVLMLLALLAGRTISLRKLSVLFDSPAEFDSRYKRIKRFFWEFELDTNDVAHLIFKLFSLDGQKVYLTIDRTNWFLGKARINVFTLGIAYEGIAIPLFWHLLPKAGNASAQEHIALIKRFIEVFGKHSIAGVLGDREFGNAKLFNWLNKQRVPFYIRIKDNNRVCIRGKKWLEAKKLFAHLNPKQKGIYGMRVNLWKDTSVFLSGSRSERGELMIVATNEKPQNAIAIYLRRWEIEMLFQSLKSRGFQFEETHITATDRLEKVMALLAIAFCWAHKVGEWRAQKKPIVLNRYRESRRPQYSYFRYGLDLLQELIFRRNQGSKEWKACIQELSFSPSHQLFQGSS